MDDHGNQTEPIIVGLDERLRAVEAGIARIEARNRRVEGDKSWETSCARKALIAVLTYLITACVFAVLEVGNPVGSALIPTAGYLISTFTIPAAKRVWLKYASARATRSEPESNTVGDEAEASRR